MMKPSPHKERVSSFHAVLLAVLIAATLGCGPSADVKGDQPWTVVPNSYATHFSVWTRGDERKLIVLGPAGEGDTIGVYFTGNHDGHAIHELERIAVVSSTHLSYISALGMIDRVVGASGLQRVRDPQAMKRVVAGAIAEIGTADGLDRERLMSLHAQVLLDYPFGRSMRQSSMKGMERIEVTEYLEEHPLGRAEWIRFFGALLGRERMADSLFRSIAERYDAAKRYAAGQEHPRIFFGSNWEGNWHVPPGNSYMSTLIEDAGGAYCFTDRRSGGNIAVDLETVMNEGGKAEHFGIIIANGGPANAELISGGDPRLAAMPSITKGGFVLDSERSDIFGQALLEPDILLEELSCTFHPGKCAVKGDRYVFEIGQ